MPWAANGEPILRSEGYLAKSRCINGIESVKKDAMRDDAYEIREAKNGQAYFVLKAANHEVIGTSETYSSGAACTTGMASVVENAPTAEVVDLSEQGG